ncbi:MAG: immunoglobulin-like domain-containing protein [Anaerofustis sp.]
MICKHCGRTLRDGTRICYYCSAVQPDDDEILEDILSDAKEEIEGVSYTVSETPLNESDPPSANDRALIKASTAVPTDANTESYPPNAGVLSDEETARKTAMRIRKRRRASLCALGIILLAVLFFVFLRSFYRPIIANTDTLEASSAIDPLTLVHFETDADGRYSFAVESSDLISDKPGTYTVTYLVTRLSDGAEKPISYRFRVVDTTPPQITIADTLTLMQGSEFRIADYASVSDNTGTIPADAIAVSGNYDVNTEGTYPLTLTVSDASGNSAEKSIALIIKGLTNEQLFFRQIEGTWYSGSTSVTFSQQEGSYSLSVDSFLYQPEGSLQYTYVNSDLNSASFTWDWSYSLMNHPLDGTRNVIIAATDSDESIRIDLGDGFGYREYSR